MWLLTALMYVSRDYSKLSIITIECETWNSPSLVWVRLYKAWPILSFLRTTSIASLSRIRRPSALSEYRKAFLKGDEEQSSLTIFYFRQRFLPWLAAAEMLPEI